MGCPDWPRCFGSFIPPTSIDQLPADYKEKYAALREKKNVKFAKYLSAFGFKDTAEKILNDKSILQETEFNPLKTWIEYLNRLVGVAIGFFILMLTYRSVKFRKTDPAIFRTSVIVLVLVIFQGWFGSIVVSTNLTTWTITLHMFLALLMVVLLAYLQNRSSQQKTVLDKGAFALTWAAIPCFSCRFFWVLRYERQSTWFPRTCRVISGWERLEKCL